MYKAKKSLLSVAIVAVTFGLAACGGSSNDSTPTATLPVNSAPTDITLSASNASENEAGATIGMLSVSDVDTSDTFTFVVSDDRFEINGTTLKLKAESTLDFVQEANVSLTITVTDSANATFNKDMIIAVNDLLDYYDYESKSLTGISSVSYTGQIARQLLINDLSKLIGAELSDASTFDTNGTFVNRDEVINALNSYFDVADYDVVSQRPLLTLTTPSSLQSMLVDLSSSSKNLVGKVAGNDATGQHKDWNNGEFVGWGTKGSTTPEQLIRILFGMLADNAQTQLDGAVRQDPFGNDITNISLTSDGLDLKQLIQKFLLMSVAFSQGVDDYLDNDVAGKGLLSDHTDTTKAYTSLEHQFDEAFGYFGAARNYLDYSDEEVAAKGGRDDYQLYHDTNGDGSIDFNSEYNFSQSTNASKRDRGATVANDFSKTAMTAFLQGRKLLNDTAGVDLTEAQRTELYGYRDTVVDTWEKAIAATVVHYINDLRSDLEKIGTDDFSYANTAKHWSEMKGFGLGLQFNKTSLLSDEDFAMVHSIMGDMPVLIGEAEVTAYRVSLLTARDLLQAAYAFDADNVANW